MVSIRIWRLVPGDSQRHFRVLGRSRYATRNPAADRTDDGKLREDTNVVISGTCLIATEIDFTPYFVVVQTRRVTAELGCGAVSGWRGWRYLRSRTGRLLEANERLRRDRGTHLKGPHDAVLPPRERNTQVTNRKA